MPHSCHRHHGNASVLPVAITMAMGVSPSNYPHGPKCKPLNQDHHGIYKLKQDLLEEGSIIASKFCQIIQRT
ncbi:hypothetical protein CHARACLAT_024982 [Characodon lateralis]|uniref:Uncharacterized protein n=1 Tax=Characodon lateralis TaxID=208331 RepID=A0ABU7F5V3_9TELE|nr:hypothetical protein [Characodon lateralis]